MSNLWLIPITKIQIKLYFISIHPEVYRIIGHISPGRKQLCFLAPVFSESFLFLRSLSRMGLINWHVLQDGGFQSISGWWRTEQWGNNEESITFTFMHLADAFIQSDLQLHSGYTFSLVHVFTGNRTHNLFAQQTQCSTTEPHRNTIQIKNTIKVFRSITSSACKILRYIHNQIYNIRLHFHISLIETLIYSGYGCLRNS